MSPSKRILVPRALAITALALVVAACSSSAKPTALLTEAAATQPGPQGTASNPAPPVLTTEPAAAAPATAPATVAPTSSEASAPSGASGIDPCSLITKAEAEATLGKTVGEPDRTPQSFSGDWCAYQAVGAADTVVIGVERGVSAEGFKSQAEEESGMEVTPVPDLGDEAYSALSVYVRKGDIFLTVSIDAGDFTTLEDRTKATVQLAQMAVARLP